MSKQKQKKVIKQKYKKIIKLHKKFKKTKDPIERKCIAIEGIIKITELEAIIKQQQPKKDMIVGGITDDCSRDNK